MSYARPNGPPAAEVILSATDLAATLGDTYAEVLAVVRDQPVAAWKLGGTTATTRAIFNVDAAYFGPLYASEVFSDGDALCLPLAEAKAEPEIACRVGADGIDAWTCGVELPSSGIVDLAGLGVRALVADRCAGGALVLGRAMPLDAPLPAAPLVIAVDGNPVTEGTLDTLLGDPFAIARDFVTEARARGFAVTPGQWIATGGLGPCRPIARAGRMTLATGAECWLDVALAIAEPA